MSCILPKVVNYSSDLPAWVRFSKCNCLYTLHVGVNTYEEIAANWIFLKFFELHLFLLPDHAIFAQNPKHIADMFAMPNSRANESKKKSSILLGELFLYRADYSR